MLCSSCLPAQLILRGCIYSTPYLLMFAWYRLLGMYDHRARGPHSAVPDRAAPSRERGQRYHQNSPTGSCSSDLQILPKATPHAPQCELTAPSHGGVYRSAMELPRPRLWIAIRVADSQGHVNWRLSGVGHWSYKLKKVGDKHRCHINYSQVLNSTQYHFISSPLTRTFQSTWLADLKARMPLSLAQLGMFY